MNIDLSNINLRRNAESRSLSAENPTGEKGKGGMAETNGEGPARELGRGWKVRPCITLKPGEVVSLMDHSGPGVIRHMWFTLSERHYRDTILRIYWDGQKFPSVEVPLGDFLCNSWDARQNITALPINVNPTGGMNIYFPMSFKKHATITLENNSVTEDCRVFYTINYTLEEVSEDALYFHSSWRRVNPLLYGEDYVILDDVEGDGQYVGTFMAWQQNNAGWWGEGEIKMFIDGDKNFPTICGTGTEDYFGGAWGFGDDFSAPYLGFQQVVKKSGEPGARMTLYRFHIQDPIFFKSKLKVTMQALGWRSEGRYLPLQDDISSIAYWYQTLPHTSLSDLPDRNAREII